MAYAQLRAFHAVADAGGFHKAAERLRLTQPAVSIQVRSLERESGLVLFRRKGRTVELTEDGRALLACTREMFRAEANALRILASAGGGSRGTLAIGADGPHVVLDVVAAFERANPDVRVKVVLANAEQTWGGLRQLRFDAAILADPPDDPGVVRSVIARQSLMALVPRRHPLAGRKAVKLDEVVAYPLIFREAGSNTQRTLEAALAKGRHSVTPRLTLGSREAVREAVMRRLGVGFLFDREVGRDPRCAAVGIEGLERSHADTLVCLKDQRRSPLIAALFAAAAGS